MEEILEKKKITISIIALILSSLALLVSVGALYYTKQNASYSQENVYYSRLATTPDVEVTYSTANITTYGTNEDNEIDFSFTLNNKGKVDTSVLRYEIQIFYKNKSILLQADPLQAKMYSTFTDGYKLLPIMRYITAILSDKLELDNISPYSNPKNVWDYKNKFPLIVGANKVTTLEAKVVFNCFDNIDIENPPCPYPYIFKPIPPDDFSPTYFIFNFYLASGQKIQSSKMEGFYFNKD